MRLGRRLIAAVSWRCHQRGEPRVARVMQVTSALVVRFARVRVAVSRRARGGGQRVGGRAAGGGWVAGRKTERMSHRFQSRQLVQWVVIVLVPSKSDAVRQSGLDH